MLVVGVGFSLGFRLSACDVGDLGIGLSGFRLVFASKVMGPGWFELRDKFAATVMTYTKGHGTPREIHTYKNTPTVT